MIATGINAIAAANGRLAACVLVHDVAEHLDLAADDLRRDVVAEAQREREDRAGDDRRVDQRHDDDRKVRHGRGPEVAGGVQQRVRQPLEPGVDGQDHVRQPQVGQRQHDRGAAPKPGPSSPNGCSIQAIRRLGLHHRLPRVDLDQVATPTAA